MWINERVAGPQVAKPRSLPTNQPPRPIVAPLDRASLTNQEAGRPGSAMPDRLMARLGPSLQVKGEISGSEDLLIDGLVEGNIHLDGCKLTAGATAKLTGDIIADEVVVSGKVKGNVHAKKRIEIKKDGSVIGDLTTAQIMIEDGAYFKGSIEIDRSAKEALGSEPSPRTAAD